MDNELVALLAEGVDRNAAVRKGERSFGGWSPSSRRAWIEILPKVYLSNLYTVALLAEGVDRNPLLPPQVWAANRSPSSRRAWIEMVNTISVDVDSLSPSSRRAWIEIRQERQARDRGAVALLAEGVDRNKVVCVYCGASLVALLAEGVDRNSAQVS